MYVTKLIRDKIFGKLIRKRVPFRYHQADENEKWPYLDRKLREECKEAIADPKSGEELADILEVIYKRGELIGLTPKDVEKLRLKKLAENGGFDKWYIVTLKK